MLLIEEGCFTEMNYATESRVNSVLSNSLLQDQAEASFPPPRPWIMHQQLDGNEPIGTFTVLSYNILCDRYATGSMHGSCPKWALKWNYRKLRIAKEIREYNADIVNLQEVAMDHFFDFFQPKMEYFGYKGIFSPKSRANTMCEVERKSVDGCAIFWKFDKFEVEREKLIEFTQIALKSGRSSPNLINRFMQTDNIAICAVLRTKNTFYSDSVATVSAENFVGDPIVVCSAHLHWRPEFSDIKLIQSMILAQEMSALIQSVSESHNIHPEKIPAMICGDLNSLPNSGAVEFLCNGSIPNNHLDLKDFRGDSVLAKFSSTSNPELYTHDLQLESAINDRFVPFTFYKMSFHGMIDYIFSTPQSLLQIGFLGSIDISWLEKNEVFRFPHIYVPSDHIPIMAQYALLPVRRQ